MNQEEFDAMQLANGGLQGKSILDPQVKDANGKEVPNQNPAYEYVFKNGKSIVLDEDKSESAIPNQPKFNVIVPLTQKSGTGGGSAQTQEDRVALQTQKDAAAAQRAKDAHDVTQSDNAVTNQRLADSALRTAQVTSEDNARTNQTSSENNQRTTTQQGVDNALTNSTSASNNAANNETSRANNAASEAGATNRTAMQGQNALAQIEANRKARIDELTQTFDQNKDLEALKAGLLQVNEKALEDVKAAHAAEALQSTQDFAKPLQDAQIAASNSTVASNTAKTALDAQNANDTRDYRNADLRRQTATTMSDMLSKQGGSMQQMLMEGAKAGTAPTAGATAAAFGPLGMAFQIMNQGVHDGWLSSNAIPKVPGFNAAPQPTGGPDGAPPPISPSPAAPPQPTAGPPANAPVPVPQNQGGY